MPKSTKVYKKRKGFNFSGRKSSKVVISTIAAPPVEAPVSSSSKKLGDLNVSYSEIHKNLQKNIIVDVDLLSSALESFVVCKKCKNEGVRILVSSQEIGLAVKLQVYCEKCNYHHYFYSSPTHEHESSQLYSINTRFVYALRCIGKGAEAGKMLCGVLNLPQPPTKFGKYNQVINTAVEAESNKSMKNAVEEAAKENGGSKDLAVAVDGSWQKRGYSSKNGVVSITSIDTGKVLDVSVLSKYCSCKDKKAHDNKCTKNFDGTSGSMEVEGALQIFRRSEEKYDARYITYLGDGDSKAFNYVEEEKIYGDLCPIEKLECVGHVMKRMGTRLRNMVKTTKNVKLADGKSLSGRGRLSNPQINKLQNYYGLAIRRNPGDLQKMKQAIWATYLHTISTDAVPQHGFCPIGPDSWCGFNKGIHNGEPYHHKGLPKAVMEAIKPHFKDLSTPELLKKCLHGKTQNVNESFNNIIWSRLPKTVFVQLNTLKLGVHDAVLAFNEGCVTRCKVLGTLGITPGVYCVRAMKRIDLERLRNARRASLAATKEGRSKNKLKMKAIEESYIKDKSNVTYGAGIAK